MENATKVMVEDTDKINKVEKKDLRRGFFEMSLLSPMYILIFIVLFVNGVDGIDLHDAIIRFVISYSGS